MSDVGERELLAIIFTDAVDSTARTASDEDYSLRILLADLDYMRNEAAVRGGAVLKNTGDGLLISFKSAVDAVECALSIQRGFADRSENTSFQHKIGVHIGDVIKKDGDIYGSGVNTASRLVAQCPAGGLCMSSTLYELVKQKSQIGQLKLQDFQLTNIEPPLKAYRFEGGEKINELRKISLEAKNKKITKHMNKKTIQSLSLAAAVVALLIYFKEPATNILKPFLLTNQENIQGISVKKLVGTWKWLNGDTVTIMPDGTCWGLGPFRGVWKYLGPYHFRITWGNEEYIDIFKIDTEGNHLQGVNQQGNPVTANKIADGPLEEPAKTTKYNLSGTWSGGIYITQVGNKVFWYHEEKELNPLYATVVFGDIIDNNLFLNYADIPKGSNRCVGSVKIYIRSNDEIYVAAGSGGWGPGGLHRRIK